MVQRSVRRGDEGHMGNNPMEKGTCRFFLGHKGKKHGSTNQDKLIIAKSCEGAYN